MQNGGSTLTLTGENYLSSLVVNTTGITGGTINLNGDSNSLINASPNKWTLSSPLNFPGTGSIYWTGGSGTLDIESPVTDSTGHIYINGGNYQLGNSGSLAIRGYALVMNDIGGSTTNFLQTGGSINLFRDSFSLSSLYLTQHGTTNYTMTGGTIQIPYLTHLAYGTGSVANLTINGPSAVFQGTEIDLNDGSNGVGGSGVINLVSGTLQTDDLFLTGAVQGYGSFNFSGGTLQPIDNGTVDQGSYLGFGNSSGSLNIAITLSGTAATISSTDASGNPQKLPVYAVLAGTGGVNLAGSGTIVLNGSNTFSGGAVVASSGTVQVGNNAAFGTGPVTVNGAVDLAGFSPTVGGLSGPAGGLIANLSGTQNSMLTVSQTATTTYAGTITDWSAYTTALTLTGSGLLHLTGSNGYSGGTTVSGGTLQLGNASAMGTGGLTANAGVVDLAGFSPTVTTLNGAAGTIASSSGAATLTVSSSGSSDTFSGTIEDDPNLAAGSAPVSLVLSGGELTLSGTDTYSGGTLVTSSGTLILANSEAIARGSSLSVGNVVEIGGLFQAPSAERGEDRRRARTGHTGPLDGRGRSSALLSQAAEPRNEWLLAARST